MNEVEARAIIHGQGWFYKERIRHKSHKKYVYAQRRQGPKMIDCYICPLSKLSALTEQKLIAKLALKSASDSKHTNK